MTTTIRGKSGKEALVSLLTQHDECSDLMAKARRMIEPIMVVGNDAAYDGMQSLSIDINSDELTGILQARLQVINTRLENLGLKIGDEVENAP